MATLYQPGMRITADRLNANSPLNWKSWTPDWSTTTGANVSSYGNAQVDCRYVQYGLMVQFSINIKFGSTTSFSSEADNWTFGLPVSSQSASAPLGAVTLYTGDTAKSSTGAMQTYDTGRFMIYIASGNVNNTAQAGGIADSQSPIVWVSGNAITGVGQYQAAA